MRRIIRDRFQFAQIKKNIRNLNDCDEFVTYLTFQKSASRME
jgi:hypothetical protein